MSRFKVLYQEKYKAGAMQILKNKLPALKHISAGSKVTGAEILSLGIAEQDGKRIEFHDIRVYVKAP